MTDRLRARGPDDAGDWVDAASGVVLGHRRLSVVDLSAAGHQPMLSRSGRYALVYNGEIYNHGELRRRLPDDAVRAMRGHSDTEVALACIEAWGIARALESFVGMFAFALWDRADSALTLVRDRLGIKPLYYAALPRGVAFASELDAIALLDGFDDALDVDALREYFRFGYVPAPHSIYGAARKVLPGTRVTFRAPRFHAAEIVRTYDPLERARAARARPFSGTEDEAADAVEELLKEAVRGRLLADVPVGAFLSGGVDSSVVVSAARAVSSTPIETFSIGNEGADFDESGAAEQVARHLGTRHTALRVTASEGMQALRDLPAVYDEPFADSSQIPTLLVSRLARRSVTVALSGDGGDEVFGGYNRHVFGPRVWGTARLFPAPLRRGVGRALEAVDQARWDALYRRLRASPAGGLLPDVRVAGQKAHKLGKALEQATFADLYVAMCSQWDAPEELLPGPGERERSVSAVRRLERALGPAEAMMLRDIQTYLPDDILTKVDRASMSVSLEVRVPLLDHRLVELAWSLPTRFKIGGGVGKRVLRRVLSRHVSPTLFDRAKAGFGVPVGEWLRGPLRGWAEDLLFGQAGGPDDLLDPEPIRRLWRAHLSGRGDHAAALWTVLSFRAWLACRRA
jgi:asparagine synthase (glutamine-hydrolysing)